MNNTPLPLKWGLRGICSRKVLGSQQAENVLGSAPLFCMSNKHHAVGNNVTVQLSCSAQLYSSHGGNSLSVSPGRHMYLCDSCIATICCVDRSHPGSHILNGSWEMPEVLSHSGSAQHPVSVSSSSLGLRNEMCLYTWLSEAQVISSSLWFCSK